MSELQKISRDRTTILFDAQIIPNPDESIFDPDYWRAQQCLTGEAQGRGTTYFFRYQQHEMVLRHYRRGGLVGKVVKDQYLYTGLQRTRAWQEFNLLADMQQHQLATPTPVAARVQHCGFYYRADLISLKIPASHDIFQHLCQQSLSKQQWAKVGQTIRRLHQQQVFHHDLNIHNLMLDQQDKIWIIDFDKCGYRNGDQWKQDNLNRLLRSLRKERQTESYFYWQEKDWDYLLKGYVGERT